MTFHISNGRVYFEEDVIRTKLLGISKATLMTAKSEFCVLILKKPRVYCLEPSQLSF